MFASYPFLPSGQITGTGGRTSTDITGSPATGGKPSVVYERFGERWEVAFAISEGQFQQVSFCNSIATTKGGTHVEQVVGQVVNSLVEIVKKKNKSGAAVKPFQIKNHIWVFVNCLIENPAFDSQTKEHMTLNAKKFGSKCNVSEEFVKKCTCYLLFHAMVLDPWKQRKCTH